MFSDKLKWNNIYLSLLTWGRITFTIFFSAVSGDGGEQSGVGPVELFLWLPVPGAVIATWGALSMNKNSVLVVTQYYTEYTVKTENGFKDKWSSIL